MKRRGKLVQLHMHCRCGREAVVALGLCSDCYSLRREDTIHISPVRGKRCCAMATAAASADVPGTGKWSIIVHHRVPERSELKLMISLCTGCHARVHRTKAFVGAVLPAMPPLLLQLWREQHPRGYEQTAADFKRTTHPAKSERLF